MIMGMGFPFHGIPIPIGNPMGIPWEWELLTQLGMGMAKEWKSPYMEMGMALIAMRINSLLRIQCLAYLYSNIQLII